MAAYYYSSVHGPHVHWSPAGPGWLATPQSVVGGFDLNGETIYVGRALHSSGDVIPGKIVPSHGVCYVAYGGQEHASRAYQVMQTHAGVHLQWSPSTGYGVPHGAVKAGQTATGEALYVGRIQHAGSFVVGKVQPSHNALYIPFGGQEIAYHHGYEVLCHHGSW